MTEFTEAQIGRIAGAVGYWKEKGITAKLAFNHYRNDNRPIQWCPLSVALRGY